MIRQTLIANTDSITFTIPAEYVGKELEVIAFRKNEVFPNAEPASKQVSFKAISIKTTGFKFNRDAANER